MNEDIEVARIEGKGWFVRYQGKEWGPSAFLPSHDDSGTFKQIVETLEIPDEKQRDLARALWKPKITMQKPPPRTEVTSPEKVDKNEETDKESGRKSQADRVILLCLDQEPELFHDQTKTPYARINQNGIHVTLPIRSKQFKTWLANLLWQAEEKAPGTEALYGAINVLEAKALFDGDEYILYNRVAPAEDGIWIDMADWRWRAIKVTADGWHIVDDPPILFKRYSHQQALIEPKPGGDPWKFLDFVNVDKEDRATRLLLLCAAISYLIPMIPHVILVFYGIQGSGKTMALKLIRRLIDPSAVEVLTLPRDERERVQQLDHHWCAFYDNVTKLPFWMSDTLCRAATGGGFTKRELYTNDQDIIYNFKRCVAVNGINIAAQRGDLLDRSLLVRFHHIPKEKRKTEEQILAEFKSHKAEILGGFLDTLSKTLRLYPSVNSEVLFRMADFTRWGCAIAMALGYEEEDFIEAYEAKVKAQVEEAAHASPVATVLIDYMETVKTWEGTPSELYKFLLDRAKDLGISTRQKAWPKAPHVLVRQLNELAPSLESLGWEVTTGIKSHSSRRIRINSVPSATSKEDARDGKDAIFPTSSRETTIKSIISLEESEVHRGRCVQCSQRRTLFYQVETFQGEWGHVCQDCGAEIMEKLKVGGAG